jgi:hypothetical protein
LRFSLIVEVPDTEGAQVDYTVEQLRDGFLRGGVEKAAWLSRGTSCNNTSWSQDSQGKFATGICELLRET